MHKIAIIKGDGIGPEVMDSALQVLDSVNFKADFVEAEAGYECFKKHGTPLPKKTIDAVKNSDSCLFGAVTTPPEIKNYKSAIVSLRQELDLFANLRPAKSYPGTDFVKEMDLFIVRENTEGMYVGIEKEFEDRVEATRIVSKKGSERILRFGFDLAKKLGEKKITIVTKANILRKSDGLFRKIAFDLGKELGLNVEEFFVDAMAMNLIKNPEKFKVIVTTNLFGDILSDEAVELAGSIGLAASGNIGLNNSVFEPVHGSAPDIAGKEIANPIACILAAKMMLEHLNEKEKAMQINNAVQTFLKNGKNLPKDLQGNATTKQVTEELIGLL